MLTRGILPMSDQLNWLDIPSATFSPALEAGATPCASPDGQTTVPSGPVPAHANLSAQQAKARGLMTSGTYGRTGSGSSCSADLASSLASRLKARLSTAGSTLFKMTWKESVTPSGRTVYRLAAAGVRPFRSGGGFWAAPHARPAKH